MSVPVANVLRNFLFFGVPLPTVGGYCIQQICPFELSDDTCRQRGKGKRNIAVYRQHGILLLLSSLSL